MLTTSALQRRLRRWQRRMGLPHNITISWADYLTLRRVINQRTESAAVNNITRTSADIIINPGYLDFDEPDSLDFLILHELAHVLLEPLGRSIRRKTLELLCDTIADAVLNGARK